MQGWSSWKQGLDQVVSARNGSNSGGKPCAGSANGSTCQQGSF